MKIAIYSRKSVYTGKGESIENQIEMCKKYISDKMPNICENDITVYEDEGFSAKNTDRPSFKQMLADMKQGAFDCIVCYRLDRISRSVSDFSSLIEEFNKRNISFICIKEEFDTSTPMGKAMMYIASVFAQLERETIAERVRDNMIELAKTGRWLGGTTPTGFVSEKTEEVVVDGKIKSSCKLKFEPTEIEVIKTIFAKYQELHSISGVSKYLIAQNIKSRAGKFYSLPGIKEVLQNPVYATCDEYTYDYFTGNNATVTFDKSAFGSASGILTYNKRNYQKAGDCRQSIDKWIVAKGKHKGIIPGKDWVAIQNRIKDNKPTGKKPAKMHNDYSLLSGMIYCSKCGHRMFAKPRSNSDELFDYICESKMKGGIKLCNCKNLNGIETDDTVLEYLSEYTNPTSDIFKLLENLKTEIQSETPKNEETEIKARIEKCNTEIDNLVKTISQKELSEIFIKRINKQIDELNNESIRLSRELEQLQATKKSFNSKNLQIDIIANTLARLKDNLNSLTIVEKRTLIKLLVEKIEWDGENLHIFIL